MQTVVCLCTLLLALPGVAAQRLSQDPSVVGAAREVDALQADAMKWKTRQVMYNIGDVQYVAHLTVGGQPILGILDTGSFDLVVFDQACATCGKAGRYSGSKSGSFKAGLQTQTLTFGSGTVKVQEAVDQVAIGPYGEINLTFWNGMSAEMPALTNAVFSCVVGVGPPETPGSDAWSVLNDDIQQLREHLSYEGGFPDATTVERLQTELGLATLAGVEPTLVKADDVRHFSICLGQKSGSDGYFIWNDTSFLDTPSLFTYIKVLGKHSWTVNMTDIQLDLGGHMSGIFGCRDGCGAIIDSGTSMILMPQDAIGALRLALRGMDVDCNDVHTLPKLTFRLAGEEFVLPPDAYISMTDAEEEKDYDEEAGAFAMSRDELGGRVRLDFGGGDCELAVLGSKSETDWGPLWILGVPFFRSYYTTFVVGAGRGDRALLAAPASRDCELEAGGLARGAGREGQPLRRLRRGGTLVPRIVRRAQTEAFLRGL